ncbi:hypothetical protein SO694_00106097 [Aureococcus anophagefferens]|uniref:Uncharacterized protein n=1 Tax=Aureococcus anophagefferens TaxID=44056 RepID=A0ABR1FMN6_AURAN|nr:hypothetical protein JL722_6984 [Aureococcus anophagefferens]
MSLQEALGLTGRHNRDYQLRLNGRDTIYNIIDLSGFDRDASLKLISDGVDATVIFYLEPETSAGDPDPELYASCSIDTLCSLPSGDDERVVALSARARRAAAAAPPCENYLQAEVAVETAHGWLTTD